MFRPILLALMCILYVTTVAQVAVNTDGSAPDNSAILDVKSSTQGFLPPLMTTAQREDISNPATGLIIFNTDSLCLEWWDGSGWFDACSQTIYTPPIPVTGGCTGAPIWMDRNLGASQAATSSTDYLSYGSLFQWGRAAEGHEIINWTSSTTSDGAEQAMETSTLATTSAPNLGNTWDGKFILEGSDPYDWLTIQDNTLWLSVSSTNNPCPIGYRLPTETELDCERQSWSSNDADGAFDSPLKLPIVGARSSGNGSLGGVGEYGYYWSSSVFGTESHFLYFNNGDAYMYGYRRTSGFSVRCFKD